ncbi:MAG: glycoside hydrolase family 27 protein [Lachnospiraceae bacterium]|nr:glycoside hydrolase family 27 protein [Lachnospiraceae bacterium]
MSKGGSIMYRPDIAPRGWNSWDCYGAAVTEKEVRQNAEFMAKYLKKYGWEYVVVDIQWYEPGATSHEYRPFADLCMDEYGRLLPAPNRFPSAADGKGFAPLAEYVHSLGLKFGIHIMRGIPRHAVHKDLPIMGTGKSAREAARFNSICMWNPDMYGVSCDEAGRAYYDSIFKLYAEWGVDFIKCDDICRELPHEEKEMIMLSEALNACGREMVLSLSPGPALLEKAELYKQLANMWRITDDFWDKWELLYAMFERAEKWSIHAGAGHYPDADMLPIGPIRQDYDQNNKTAFTEDEQITMMSLWSIMRSPLMIGGEMTGFDDFTMKLITNEAILKMHADSRNARQIFRRDMGGNEYILWAAESCEGGKYIAAFNAGETDGVLEFSLGELEGIEQDAKATELWSGESLTIGSTFKTVILAHGAKVFRL